MQFYCPGIDSLGESAVNLLRDWAFLTSTDVDLLRGSLLVACREICMASPERTDYAELLIQYKLKLVTFLRQALSIGDLSLNRRAVTTALLLTYDEVSKGVL